METLPDRHSWKWLFLEDVLIPLFIDGRDFGVELGVSRLRWMRSSVTHGLHHNTGLLVALACSLIFQNVQSNQKGDSFL